PQNVIFLLTANSTDSLLPTILSRCQHIRLNPLSQEEIADGLVKYDGFNPDDAGFLARISGGNYSLTRFYDLEELQSTRKEVVSFLRLAYSQDVPALLKIIQDWQSKLNTESQIGLCNTLEMFLRDLLVYRETADDKLISNIDQKEVIISFCESLTEARLTEMIEHLQGLKGLLYQNIQFKLIFTVLAIRYSFLMRGKDPVIPTDENWQHLPALELNK
ncbi:MAG: DNA polymerase III subunit delta' C-terminal domain-containing protein, partial [Balneolaceae bacterium]